MKKLNIEDMIATLAAFDGRPVEAAADNDLNPDLHDDHFLPRGCKSYDEFADGDIYELLGKD